MRSNLGSNLCIGRSVWKKFFAKNIFKALFMRELTLPTFRKFILFLQHCKAMYKKNDYNSTGTHYYYRTMLSGHIRRKATTAVLLINYASSYYDSCLDDYKIATHKIFFRAKNQHHLRRNVNNIIFFNVILISTNCCK